MSHDSCNSKLNKLKVEFVYGIKLKIIFVRGNEDDVYGRRHFEILTS